MVRALIIALIVGICHLNGIQSKISTKTIGHTIPFKQSFIEDVQLVNSSQVYGACSKKSTEDRASCRFFLETNRPINSTDRVLTCDFVVTLPADAIFRDRAFLSARATAIDKDRAVMLLTESCVNKLYLINFPNCQVVPVEYKTDTGRRACNTAVSVQSPRDGCFDVMLEDIRPPRFKEHLRRLTFDLEGQVLADVPQWFQWPRKSGEWTFLYSPNRGRLVADIYQPYVVNTDLVASIIEVDDKGTKRTLREFQPPGAERKAMSVTNELLTVCLAENRFSNITCIQHGEDGEPRFEAEFPYDSNVQTVAVTVHNLAGGGFNLVTEWCSPAILGTPCSPEQQKLTVRRVDRAGKVVGSLRIPAFVCYSRSHVRYYEADNGEHCFAAVCPESGSEQTIIRHDVICYSDEDYVSAASAASPI